MLATLIFADALGGGIVSFAIPMLLFVIVAGTLYSIFLGTRQVPGHQVDALAKTPGPAPPTAAISDTAAVPEGGGAAPAPGPAPTVPEDVEADDAPQQSEPGE